MQKTFFSTIIILFLMVTLTCCDKYSFVVGAEAGPIDIGISIDSAGQVSITGGFTPKLDVKLGIIGLYAGVESTLELTKSKPYYLFIVWEDATGEIYREEYEIGKKFHVYFNQYELIKEIQGENNSIIVVIDSESVPQDLPTNIPEFSPDELPQETYFSCPGAPQPRVKIDDLALVTYNGLGAVRLRSSPEVRDDNIIEKLPEGERFKIIEGPECAPIPGTDHSFVFWYVRVKSTDRNGWVAEGDLDNYYIEAIN